MFTSLTDDQWQKIRALGLPDAARQKIEDVIKLFRDFELAANSHPPAETRDEIESVRKDVLVSLSGLERLLENPNAHAALTRPEQTKELFVAAPSLEDPSRPFLPQTTRLEGLRALTFAMAFLRYFANWLATASQRVEDTKRRGPNTEHDYWLVNQLGAIREEFTGLKITRSRKRNDSSRSYIAGIIEIAGLKVGKGTIDRAMKDYITRRGNTDMDELARRSQAHSSTDSS